jgi:hypothetical protein
VQAAITADVTQLFPCFILMCTTPFSSHIPPHLQPHPPENDSFQTAQLIIIRKSTIGLQIEMNPHRIIDPGLKICIRNFTQADNQALLGYGTNLVGEHN